jgi:hypothetical protein
LCMGDAQRLTNGNTMIGWGCNLSKALTEVKPDGSKAFEIAFDGTYASYRAFRFTWHGFPTWAPKLIIRSDTDSIDLKFSWNGATDVEKYAIYGGNSRQPSTLITEKIKSGFETGVTLTGSQTSFCYYRVMPINIENRPTQFSNVVINPACPSLYLPFINNDGN